MTHPLLGRGLPALRRAPLLRPFAPAAPRLASSSAARRSMPAPLVALAATAHVVFFTGLGMYGAAQLLPFRWPIDTAPLPPPEPWTSTTTSPAPHPAVQVLRDDPSWSEAVPWSGLPPEQKATKLSAGTLAGPRRIEFYHLFLRDGAREAIAVVRLGSALAGYPGVVHGGVLATLLDEACGRVALAQFPNRNGVTARLSVDYRRPTPAHRAGEEGGIYLIRTILVEGNERKATVRGTVEDPQGNVLVEADALFVVPRSWALAGMKNL